MTTVYSLILGASRQTRWLDLQQAVRVDTNLWRTSNNSVGNDSRGASTSMHESSIRSRIRSRARQHGDSSGIAVSQMRTCQRRSILGDAVRKQCCVISAQTTRRLRQRFWAFCTSDEFTTKFEKLTRTLKVTNATFVKVPFDSTNGRQSLRRQYPHGLAEAVFRRPDPMAIQRAIRELAADPLQVAVARLARLSSGRARQVRVS